ncbi:MAG: hypothetical protein V5A55_02765 [Halovenus sp.]
MSDVEEGLSEGYDLLAALAPLLAVPAALSLLNAGELRAALDHRGNSPGTGAHRRRAAEPTRHRLSAPSDSHCPGSLRARSRAGSALPVAVPVVRFRGLSRLSVAGQPAACRMVGDTHEQVRPRYPPDATVEFSCRLF